MRGHRPPSRDPPTEVSFILEHPDAGPHRASLFVVCLALVLQGCADLRDPEEVAQIDTLPGGAVTVDNYGVPAWKEGAGWRLRETLRLGRGAGEDPYSFGDVAAVEADSDGSIYVLDWRAQEVRVFDEGGTFSHVIGERGGGAGGLQGAAGLAFDFAGRLWVWDPPGRQYVVFRQDGTFVAEHGREVRGVSYPWAGTVDWRDNLWDFAIFRATPGEEEGEADDLLEYWVPVRGKPAEGRLTPLAPLTREVPGRREGVPRPDEGDLVAVVDPQGYVWFGHNHTYRLHKRTPRGDTLRILTLPYQPTTRSPQEIDSAVASYRRVGVPVSEEDVSPTRPVLRRLAVDDEGHLLVFVDVEGAEPGTLIDVFDADGLYLGRLRTELRFDLSTRPVLKGDALYGEVRGEEGTSRVVRFRVER